MPLPFDDGGFSVEPRPGFVLRTAQQECPHHQLATLDWELPDLQSADATWRFSSVVACDAETVQVALLSQAMSSTAVFKPLDYLVPADYQVALGILVAKLLNHSPLEVAGRQIPTRPLKVRADEVDRFVQETLLQPDRWLPVVVLALDAVVPLDDETLTEIQKLALGWAQVVSLDRSAAAKLKKLLGANLSCGIRQLRRHAELARQLAPRDGTACAGGSARLG